MKSPVRLPRPLSLLLSGHAWLATSTILKCNVTYTMILSGKRRKHSKPTLYLVFRNGHPGTPAWVMAQNSRFLKESRSPQGQTTNPVYDRGKGAIVPIIRVPRRQPCPRLPKHNCFVHGALTTLLEFKPLLKAQHTWKR